VVRGGIRAGVREAIKYATKGTGGMTWVFWSKFSAGLRQAFAPGHSLTSGRFP